MAPEDSTRWDANLYLKFADARMRPALDLMGRLDPANARFLRRWEQLQVAEQALSAVVRFHGSARERGVRKGDSWQPVVAKLRAARLALEASAGAEKTDPAPKIEKKAEKRSANDNRGHALKRTQP